jgi:hypothetical protein
MEEVLFLQAKHQMAVMVVAKVAHLEDQEEVLVVVKTVPEVQEHWPRTGHQQQELGLADITLAVVVVQGALGSAAISLVV